jgi:peptidoglycan hydrolase-like protein with peptidoglycan-binding domain
MGQQPQQRQQTQQPQQGQTQQGQAAQGQGAQGQVNLTPQQRTQISQTVLSGRNVPRVNNVNFALSVGTVVPARVRFAAVPAALIEINPAWRGHEFFVVQDDIVIVDNSRKIVAMVPVGSSGGRVGSSTSIHGGGTEGAMDLSVDEIRQVQMVLVDKGFDVEVDGRLGPRTRQALIAFQRQQGLSATGTIDHQTVGALGVSVHGMQGGAQGTTTGQGGMQQQPNQAPAGGAQSGQTGNQPSTNGQGTQQPSANPPAASGGQRSQSGSQPSTAGQGSRQQPSANEDNMNQNTGGSSNPSGAGTPAQQPK